MLDIADHTRPADPRQEIHTLFDAFLFRIGPAYGRLFAEEEYQSLSARLSALGWGEQRISMQGDRLLNEWVHSDRVRLRMVCFALQQADGNHVTWWQRAA